MARARPIFNSFNAGEVSPLAMGRMDQARFFSSLETCENWLPMTLGGLRVRGGFKYAGQAKNTNTLCYLVPFVYSASLSYMLEFGPSYIRFWKYNATTGEPEQIADVAGPLEISTTYLESELADLQVIQSGAALFIVHPNHAPARLTMASETSWTLSTISFTPPPTYEPQTDLAQTLGVGANSGSGIKFRAGGAVFLAADVGREITSGAGRAVITALDDAWQVTVDILQPFSATISAGLNSLTTVGTAATSTAHGLAAGNYIVVTSGAQAGQVRRAASITDADHFTMDAALPADVSGVSWNKVLAIASGGWFLEGSPNAKCTASAAGPKNAVITLTLDAAGLRSGDVGKYVHLLEGTAKITAYIHTAQVNAEVISYLDSWTPSVNYALGGTWTMEAGTWTAGRGYPKAITIGQQRVWYAGAAGEPETIRGTTSGDYYAFTVGTYADDSLEYRLGTEEVNIVQWLHYWRGLVAGALGAEITVRSPSGDPLGGSVLPDIGPASTFGAEGPRPDRVGNVLLFIARGGRSVIAWGYDFASDAYDGVDMLEWANHFTQNYTLTRSTYQKTASGNIKGLVWYVRSDGQLCCLTFNSKQQVAAWSRHPLGGTSPTVMSVATIPNPVLNRDDLWISVTRTIGGATKRYIEVLDFGRYLDCSVAYSGAATATISGLTHLNGETVWIRGKASTDGKWRIYPSQVVAGGQVTGLNPTVTEAEIGFYAGATATLPPVELAGALSLQGRPKGWGQATIRCYDTPLLKIGGVRYKAKGSPAGYSAASVYVIPTTDAIAPSGDWGEIEISGLADYDRTGQITFQQDLPVGGTLLMFVGDLDVGE